MTTTTFIQQNLTANGFTKRNRKSRLFSQNLYQVDVEGEDGDHITFEVTADSCAEATAAAERMAMDVMVDIQYITVTALD